MSTHQEEGGKKFDTGKLRMDLIPPELMKEVAKVLEFGASKYGDYNWHKGIEFSRMYAAALRHMIAWWEGENYDPESGINHVSHALCNLSFLIQFINENHTLLDNRPAYKL